MVSKLGIQYSSLKTVWVKEILLDIKWLSESINFYALDIDVCHVFIEHSLNLGLMSNW